jgi:uncharacterized membrane protein (UPF0127 family)
MALRNARTGAIVASALEPAFESATRNRGLLGRETLAPGHALVIAPSNLVHTFFMRFALDLIFVSRRGDVVKIRTAVPRSRIVGALRAFAVVEMNAGSLAGLDLVPGDRLELATL